jgi:uncharacterized repeat protein (TIGR01451 family)
VEETANIEVVKSMCPNPIVCGDIVTYTIRIYNYGNTAAENVVITDTFSPIPDNITVYRNGVVVPETNYTFIGGTLTVPATSTDGDTIPAATYIQDPTTGEFTTIPGIVEYVITGTI